VFTSWVNTSGGRETFMNKGFWVFQLRCLGVHGVLAFYPDGDFGNGSMPRRHHERIQRKAKIAYDWDRAAGCLRRKI
jgi:hypothetical protein